MIKNKRHAEKNKMKKETKKLKRMMTNRAEDIDQNTKLVKTYYSESEDEKGGNKDEVEGESVLSNTVRKAKKHCRNERYREQAMIVEDFVNEKKRKKEITMKKLVQNTANPTQGLHQIFLPQNKSARARLFE